MLQQLQPLIEKPDSHEPGYFILNLTNKNKANNPHANIDKSPHLIRHFVHSDIGFSTMTGSWIESTTIESKLSANER